MRNKGRLASEHVYISPFQVDPIELLRLHQEGRVRPLDHLEHIRPYHIVHIDRICIVEMAWFLIHIREDPTDIRSDAYICFPADDMFTTNSEIAINQ